MYPSIVTALDGSEDSLAGAALALDIARGLGSKVFAVHVYDSRIHNSRFREMEPGLPEKYRSGGSLKKLRTEHDSLMTDGFQALSHGYMEDIVSLAREKGVNLEEVVIENRNYVGILQFIDEKKVDLVILGATGLGSQHDGLLGSTAARILRKATCDVLIARHGEVDDRGPVLVGTDGSAHALAALEKGAALTDILGGQLHVAAAYDVAFHQNVFKTMAHSMSVEKQQEVGLDRQETLHEDLIDKSLEALYGNYLNQAAEMAVSLGCKPKTELLRGKAYRALTDLASREHAAIVVLGRFGHNREDISDLGSNAEAVVRLSKCSVLITAAAGENLAIIKPDEDALDWEQEALQRLERIPSHARAMARKGIEEFARSTGATQVTTALFQQAANHFGMTTNNNRETPDNV